jgi:tRNA(Ile)-lysidine synthase
VLSATASPPLGVDEFAARLARLAFFESAPSVAVAVSGGPDSLALAILADRWARECHGRICALSVDHRLRAESGAEIARVREWLAARSIRHDVLVWRGEKPATGIQAAARAARYRLLEEWCQQQGWLHLMTGHHREDQIETFCLRRDAHSGRDGLAGMPTVRELAGCRILRPLLDVPKARLLATLAAERQPFIIDPSNLNPNFARTRLRRRAEQADLLTMLGNIRTRGRERRVREHRGCALLARAAALHPAGFVMLNREVLLAAPPDVAERALSVLVMAFGDRPHPPRRRSIVRLLEVLAGGARGGHVLGGHRFVAWRERVLVLRELAAAAAPARLVPGEIVVWDRRFEILSPPEAGALTLGYLGKDGVVELYRRLPGFRHARLPPLIYPVLLGFWDGSGLAAVPSLKYRRDERVVLPKLALKPVNCLSHASFAVV